MLRIVVAILNYNGVKLLGSTLFDCIKSALQLNINYPNLDVIVIDNNSTDDSPKIIEDIFGKDVFLIRLNKNYGYAGGIEFGIRCYIKLKGYPDYVLVMNNDFIIKNSEFLNEMIKFSEKWNDIILVQGINLKYDNKHVDNAGCFLLAHGPMPLLRYRDASLREYPETPSYVSFVSGTCFLAKYRPIISLRGYFFNSKLFSHWEDCELSLSLWSYGFKSIALPIPVGIHIGSMSFKKFASLGNYTGLRNRELIDKHYILRVLPSIRVKNLINRFTTLSYKSLQGYKGKIFARALIDGLRLYIDLNRGLCNPLIMIPREWKYHFNTILPDALLYKILEKSITRIKFMSVNKDMLKDSPRPFIIYI